MSRETTLGNIPGQIHEARHTGTGLRDGMASLRNLFNGCLVAWLAWLSAAQPFASRGGHPRTSPDGLFEERARNLLALTLGTGEAWPDVDGPRNVLDRSSLHHQCL